jgi:hypothetical protein
VGWELDLGFCVPPRLYREIGKLGPVGQLISLIVLMFSELRMGFYILNG